MPVTRHGVNVVDASGSLMLLTETSGGDAIHLTEDGMDRRFIQVQVGHECDSSTAV